MFLSPGYSFIMQHMHHKVIHHQYGWRYGYQGKEKYAVGFEKVKQFIEK